MLYLVSMHNIRMISSVKACFVTPYQNQGSAVTSNYSLHIIEMLMPWSNICSLSLMLLVANLVNTKLCKKNFKRMTETVCNSLGKFRKIGDAGDAQATGFTSCWKMTGQLVQ